MADPTLPEPDADLLPPAMPGTTSVSAGSSLPTLLEPRPAPTGVPPGSNLGAPAMPPAIFIPPPPAYPQWYPDWMTGQQHPILNQTPNAINQILLAPYANSRPSRTTGPLMSGPIGMGQVTGSALLALPLWVDYSMGSFSLPVQFPPGCILLWIQMTTYADWAGGAQSPAISIGSTVGTSDIFGPDEFPLQHVMILQPMIGTLPFATDPNPWQAWLTVDGYANTSGAGFLSLIYGRF